MTKKEYIQLVRGSEVFNKFEKDFQEKILNANGEERKSFEAVFLAEKNDLADENKILTESTTKILGDFSSNMNKSGRDYLKKAEQVVRSSENPEELLKSI